MPTYKLGIRVNIEFELESENDETAKDLIREFNETRFIEDILVLLNEQDYQVYDYEAMTVLDEDDNVIAQI